MRPSANGHLDYSFVGRQTPLIQNLQFWLLFLAPISIQNSNLNQLIYKGSTLLQNILSLYKQRMRFIIQDPDSPRVLEEATSTVLVHSVFIDMVCNQCFHCLFSRALVNFYPHPLPAFTCQILYKYNLVLLSCCSAYTNIFCCDVAIVAKIEACQYLNNVFVFFICSYIVHEIYHVDPKFPLITCGNNFVFQFFYYVHMLDP